ncbi:uncharacterized protein N7477_003500 [Penicillium maclennaniae]|uniref:uncharacterized protein n=1 Tax=Penicillium maclennaniae TaxID=1343394 RepID=UPI00254209D8|nr:uncharacterized protein N7477_003500 [Penicillium maclennaniae]KAJ5677867.1 hypothetical protein N7477_003500 [Penicillium maclennaniae]
MARANFERPKGKGEGDWRKTARGSRHGALAPSGRSKRDDFGGVADLQMLGFHWHFNTNCEADSAAKERSGPEVIDIALDERVAHGLIDVYIAGL